MRRDGTYVAAIGAGPALCADPTRRCRRVAAQQLFSIPPNDPALARLVTVPVARITGRPTWIRCRAVDVYATAKTDGAAPVRILAGVTVGSVPSKSRDVFGASGQSSAR